MIVLSLVHFVLSQNNYYHLSLSHLNTMVLVGRYIVQFVYLLFHSVCDHQLLEIGKGNAGSRDEVLGGHVFQDAAIELTAFGTGCSFFEVGHAYE